MKKEVHVEEGQEVVGRTIVGGRPMVRRKTRIAVPIGVEKVLCRAVMDGEFKEALFRDREEALEGCGLKPSERAILTTVPPASLEAMIEQIDLPRHGKKRFMRTVRACLFAAATSALAVSCAGEDASAVGDPSESDVVVNTHMGADGGGILPDDPRDVYMGLEDVFSGQGEVELNTHMGADAGGILPDPPDMGEEEDLLEGDDNGEEDL